MDVRRTIQEITFISSVASLGGLLYWMRRHRDLWFLVIPLVTWMTHLIIFYLFVFSVGSNYEIAHPDFTNWSALVRLHGAGIVCGYIYGVVISDIMYGKKFVRPSWLTILYQWLERAYKGQDKK